MYFMGLASVSRICLFIERCQALGRYFAKASRSPREFTDPPRSTMNSSKPILPRFIAPRPLRKCATRIIPEIASLSSGINRLSQISRMIPESFVKFASPKNANHAARSRPLTGKIETMQQSAGMTDSVNLSSRWMTFCGVLARPSWETLSCRDYERTRVTPTVCAGGIGGRRMHRELSLLANKWGLPGLTRRAIFLMAKNAINVKRQLRSICWKCASTRH
jgi:hypothetical protein